MVYFNGKIISGEGAAVPIEDRGFRYGDGLFETMRAYGGQVFRLARHVERLVESASVLGIELGPILSDSPIHRSESAASPQFAILRKIAEAVETVVAVNEIGEGVVRIILTRGAGEGFDVPEELRPNLIVTARPFTPVSEERVRTGARAIISDIRRNTFSPISRVKSLNFLESVLVRQEARKAGVDEGLMLDTEGHLVEASVANLFFVREGALYTPPTSGPILPGITREVVMALASERSIPCFERAFFPEELADTEEAFTTSTLMELMPLVQINGRPVGAGAPGAVTRTLIAAYRELVRAHSVAKPPPKN
ncbi:MAG: aminotransferase class IV [Candidatus Latescibacteria bacterium]|nr:aminotransferase class IV [Candidatus Latescibacterota bacterium]